MAVHLRVPICRYASAHKNENVLFIYFFSLHFLVEVFAYTSIRNGDELGLWDGFLSGLETA